MLMPKSNQHIDMNTIDTTEPTVATLEHERLLSLVNSMADGVIAVNEHQVVMIYNGAALNILDINIDLYNKPIRRYMRLIDRDNKPVDIDQLISNATTQYTTRDLRLLFTNGEKINLYLSVAPVHLGYGVTGARGHVILLRDITREKSLEEERDEFISVVSHELRTPIAIAEGNIGNAQLIANKAADIPAMVNLSLKAAYDQIIFLGGMINDLATLSRAERGTLNVEIEKINAHTLLKDLEQNYQSNAKAKGLTIDISSDPHLHLLQSSKLYVREILQNFITNALKYTEKGSIRISAYNKPGGVLFEITDSGIGISKSDKQKVFEKFFRSEDFRTRQNAGTGLGLYVTSKLAKLVSATISLESELDHGSTFSVFFPNIK